MSYNVERQLPLPTVIQGCTWIPLTKGQFALVDNIDSDLAAFNWCATTSKTRKTFYAIRGQQSTRQKLHKVIASRMGIYGEVEHKDQNGLNNRRFNLRSASQAQNVLNVSKRKSNTSGYIGVPWRKDRGCWVAKARINKKDIFLGFFEDKIKCAQAYDRFILSKRGEFAFLNFPILRLTILVGEDSSDAYNN